MKIGIIGDVHWSKYSSIIRGRGDRFSTRLENCIDSINWAEDTLQNLNCNHIFYLGDFFDKSELYGEEISALKSIKWAPCSHTFLVGNHEISINDNSYNTADVFSLLDIAEVIYRPQTLTYKDIQIDCLPYLDSDLLDDAVNSFTKSSNIPRLLLSHNDMKGIQMGKFISEVGLDINIIEDNYDLCVNGHLHNGQIISPKVINIGNLTGQNFSEDAFKYSHNIIVVDTKDLSSYTLIENPFAFNFYKLDYTDGNEYTMPKDNKVITLKCKEHFYEHYKNLLDLNPSVVASRIILQPDTTSQNITTDNISLTVDHLEKFQEFILQELGTSDKVKEELIEVIK